MCKLPVGTKAIVRFLKAPSLCLISFAIVWLEEMSLYFAFDFRPGLITPPLSLSVQAYLIFPSPFPSYRYSTSIKVQVDIEFQEKSLIDLSYRHLCAAQ